MAKPLINLPKIELPSQPPPSSGWGARIENMIIRALIGVISPNLGTFSNIISWGFKNYLEDAESELIELAKPLLQPLVDSDALPVEFRNQIKEALTGSHQVGVIIIGIAILSLFTGGIPQILSPLWEVPRQNLTGSLTPTLLPADIAVKAHFRYGQDWDQWARELVLAGLNSERIAKFIDVQRPRVGAGELLHLRLRFPEDRNIYDDMLGKLGFDIEEQRIAQKAILQYPGPQDIVRFAVRDVYKENVVSKYGYDEDMPDEFERELQKSGFAADFSKYYWRAHWNLPSINDVIEMFHRTNFEGDPDRVDLDTVKEYLRINDYPAFWRDKIVRITYNVATRVDARRLFEAGIWDRERLKKEHIRQGYDEEIAEALTKLAEADKNPIDKDLTRSTIETAYKDRIWSYDQALEGLQGIGYTEDQAKLYLSIIDYNIQQSRLKEDLDRLEYLYVNNEIGTAEVAAELGQYNVTGDFQSNLFADWDIRRKKNISLPTQAELEEFYLSGIITIDQYGGELDKKNYSPERKMWTLTRADQKLQNAAKKATEDAQKEADRLATIATTSEYQTQRQQLEIANAQLRLQIADVKVALHDITDETQASEGQAYILQLQDEIKKNDLSKAQLYGQFLSSK